MTMKGPGKPPRKGNVKGALPVSDAETAAVTNYSERKGEGEKTTMNLTVEEAWRRNLLAFALAHNTKGVRVIKAAVAEYLDRKGWKGES